ncbi:Acyl-transf-3 domain-containing protein [Aphelenchoides besseyi]|nr:Acyl-transf-3 domain-containing protein [Aphelenchoides besseyi]
MPINNEDIKSNFSRWLLKNESTKMKNTCIRLELQGLRGIAIGAVLLFHVWDRIFPLGYLGVDVFFVLSGYLMCSILCRQRSLTLAEILEFYFRRLKRIVPTYVFVIFGILVVCVWLLSPMELKKIANESIPSLFFYSNFPSVHATSYFDQQSKMNSFLHTWSLSNELQFYCLCPLIFLVMNRLSNYHVSLKFVFIFTAITFSFYCQSTVTSNASYMELDGRIYQYLFGFLSHFVYDFREFELMSVDNDRWWKFVLRVRDHIPIVTVMAMLLVDFTLEHQIQRLLITVLTTLVITIHYQESTILSQKLLLTLGDISYCVYVVHWPILVLHRHLFPNQYVDGNVNWLTGVGLILLSIVVGFGVEELVKRLILIHVRSWLSLICILFFLYSTTVSLVVYMNHQSLSFPKEMQNNKTMLILNQTILEPDYAFIHAVDERRRQLMLRLWETRNSTESFSLDETIAISELLKKPFQTCRNNTKKLPTRYTNGLTMIANICHEKGNVDKNVLILGNSHASVSFPGIFHAFRSIANKITLMSGYSCTPVPQQYQQKGLNPASLYFILTIAFIIKYCMKVNDAMIRIVKEWTEPLDIIIPIFGFNYFTDVPINGNLKDDKMFQYMSNFYGNLSTMVKEVMLLPSMHPGFKEHVREKLQSQLAENITNKAISETRSEQLQYLPGIRNRLEQIECDRCVKINWLDLWCAKQNICYGVEPKRNVAYFLDRDHLSVYGSMFAGHFLFDVYKNMTVEQ